jgi:hypothetical protein
MIDVQVFEIDRVILRKCVEDALKQRPVLVSMYPMLENTRLYFSEVEPGVRMECKPMPVFPINLKVTNKESFSGAGQIEDSNHFIDLGINEWADGTCAGVLAKYSNHSK